MLKGRMESVDRKAFEAIALNEIVVTRKDSMKVAKLSISVNGRFFSSYTANGVILSTPHGVHGLQPLGGRPHRGPPTAGS